VGLANELCKDRFHGAQFWFSVFSV
jgi:hypothetical protein